MNDIEKIREYFSRDLYATEVTGVVIEDAHKNYAKCSLEIRPEHRNALGGVMGGAYFTLADLTFAVASNIGNPPTVSVTGQITYLGVTKGEKLIAESECLHSGRSGCSFLIRVRDDLGNDVAAVTFYGFRKDGTTPMTGIS